jgi:diguanylate cyclase (GGDEF)-like protein
LRYIIDKVLIIEDSKTVAELVKRRVKNRLNYEVVVANTFEEARGILETEEDLSVVILALVLPDAEYEEVVDYVLSKTLPVIVATSRINDDVRDKILSKNVVDYFLKTGEYFIDYLIKTLKRLSNNRRTKILLIDDSIQSREQIAELLRTQQLMIYETGDIDQALKILEEEENIRMVIADCHNHNMDAVDLVTQIREKYPPEKTAVIGISSKRNPVLSARLLKNGATDFVIRPFSGEEFICRINQNLEMLEYIRTINQSAVCDHLTNLYNRRYIFEIGRNLYQNAKRKHLNLTMCMLDIDHFKRINDTYGHQGGDLVLKSLARILKGHFRSSDIISRYGGEEFLILAANLSVDNCEPHLQKLRGEIESITVKMNSEVIRFTVSMGVTNQLNDNFESMINQADELLYQAKRAGRNQIIFDSGCSDFS